MLYTLANEQGGAFYMAKILCGTIKAKNLKIPGKPNRAMTPEVKLAPVWADRKNDYRRSKEKQKIRRYSDEYGNDGFLFTLLMPRECANR